MLQLQRQNDILRLLKERKEMTVKELCALLFSSPATVRRDLAELEQKGLVKRSFGGAVLVEDYSSQLPHSIRYSDHIAQKKHICANAVQYIRDGDTLFVDASSTTYFLAPYLKKFHDISVITNNPCLCIVLSEMKIHNLCTGGEMLHDSFALVGRDAEKFVSQIQAHKCFFSARGFSDRISDSSKRERDLKIEMLNHSLQHFFLCDRSKQGQIYPYIIADLSDVTVITEENERTENKTTG